jgi:hypothetical protein
MVFCKDGQTYELDAKSWANRRSNEIAIYYDYRRSITADTVDAILNKKPFVYYVEKELIDPNSIQITRDNFNSTFARRAARKVLRRLMKEQDISIRIRTIFVALRDPVLLIDAGVCMAGVAGDAMEMMRLAVQNRQPARRK